MFFYDPLYMVVMMAGMVLVFIPQMLVQSTYKKYARIPNKNGLSGREVAEQILAKNGLGRVRVEMGHGVLSDHYDPRGQVIRLSPDVYEGTSIASATIAAHEVGHAVQHAKDYHPVSWRAALVPLVGFGSGLGPWLIIIALMMGIGSAGSPELGWYLGWAGIALYGAAVLFHFVTLPVEFDASGRALKILKSSNYLHASEMDGAKKVLTAAAFTYIATALYALMQLLYFVFRLLGSSRRD